MLHLQGKRITQHIYALSLIVIAWHTLLPRWLGFLVEAQLNMAWGLFLTAACFELLMWARDQIKDQENNL